MRSHDDKTVWHDRQSLPQRELCTIPGRRFVPGTSVALPGLIILKPKLYMLREGFVNTDRIALPIGACMDAPGR